MILQDILQPDENICSEKAMFYHIEDKAFVFDTDFNFFSLEKWKTYTTIQNLKLHLACNTSVQVLIYDEKSLLKAIFFDEEKAECIDLSIDYKKTSRFIYFAVHSLRENAVSPVISGYYYTDDVPTQDVMLALDICTYRRETFVYRNMKMLENNILRNPESPIYNKVQIFISDNGQSLDSTKLEDEHIRVYPNINAGGTGGFSRGILEILKRKNELGLTHMIFMDDDIVLHPDSLVRTYGLLSYVRDEYKEASIAGAMLRLDARYIQHEVAANWEGGDPVVVNQGLDLRCFDHIRQNEELRQGNYAAWWYACYPLSIVSENNMPIPFFLHMDDVEYGLRNQHGIMTLNGINVWHSVFENKRASSLSYYDIRNIMLTNAIYFEDGNLRFMKKYIMKRFMANTLRYRYKDVRMTYLAVKDFCKGPVYLMQLDPQEKNQQLMERGYKMIPISQMELDEETRKHIESYQKPDDITDVYKPFIVRHKWKYMITANGWLLPSCKNKVYDYPMGIHPYALFRKQDVILFDPDSKTGMMVHKSWHELIGALWLILKTYLLLALYYKKSQKAYQQNIHRMQSAEFWRSYLKLER